MTADAPATEARERIARIYVGVPLAAGGEVRLPPAQSHHVARVLRLAAGSPLVLFNGDGAEYAAVITNAGRSAVAVRVGTARALQRESPLRITLAQGVSRGSRMDYTVQKAVELGVARIEPVLTARGVVRTDAAAALRKAEHWRGVAIAACEQCGRTHLPELAPLRDWHAWLAGWRNAGAGVRGILLDPGAALRLRDVPLSPGALTLLAGPEGGLTGGEREGAVAAGFTAVRLGPRILRTETAALAALAAMQALWGDF